MTDHPMSCYPGHLERWAGRNGGAWEPSFEEIRKCNASGFSYWDCILLANRAIESAMSGQITSSTGDKNG